jgi:ribonuclease HI
LVQTPFWFCKLNFDGASKGNPGPAGFGAVFQNDQSHILHIITGGIGYDSNNATEL